GGRGRHALALAAESLELMLETLATSRSTRRHSAPGMDARGPAAFTPEPRHRRMAVSLLAGRRPAPAYSVRPFQR
ncbi:hypothetical protein, partial [Cronobacter sakazakii]|uniref:hypothetical protein n=1 Tax=Cronobacter sakazakii TaxID=28141 RepID=UPI001F2B44B2